MTREASRLSGSFDSGSRAESIRRRTEKMCTVQEVI